jgi:hypothetical protein
VTKLQQINYINFNIGTKNIIQVIFTENLIFLFRNSHIIYALSLSLAFPLTSILFNTGPTAARAAETTAATTTTTAAASATTATATTAAAATASGGQTNHQGPRSDRTSKGKVESHSDAGGKQNSSKRNRLFTDEGEKAELGAAYACDFVYESGYDSVYDLLPKRTRESFFDLFLKKCVDRPL